MFYPNRRAFFQRLALSLSLQPALKIGLAEPAQRGAGGEAKHRAAEHEGKLKITE
jgi:hypothetical protein